jgi:hypothetical protein
LSLQLELILNILPIFGYPKDDKFVGGMYMKKQRQSFSKFSSHTNPHEELDNVRYYSLIEEGYTDAEIAKEFDLEDSYFKSLRDEWREE